MKRKSYNDPGHAHFLTFSCYHHQQLLIDDNIRTWLTESIARARKHLDFRLWAWVIMPEHVHLLLHPKSEQYSISRILSSIKGPLARQVLAFWRKHRSYKLRQLRVVLGGKVTYRFWQAGGGFDRNVHSWARIRKAVDYIEFNPVRRGLVREASEWRWSSAWERSGKSGVALKLDEFEFSG